MANTPPRGSLQTTHVDDMIIESRPSVILELWRSADVLFRNKMSCFLLLGPIAVLGQSLGFLGEAASFCLAGVALVPCAERLSFITEQIAEHTNGTIGALLNATFGNAPELLITIAALRSGYYRVVQLTMLGSMMSNMILVFGGACLIGGLRWQVQDLRMMTGNVNVGMMLVATAGFLFPAALVLSGQLPYDQVNKNVPTHVEIVFCRVNASVMMILYLCFLLFQIGTHADEFEDKKDEDEDVDRTMQSGQSISHMRGRAKRNLFCLFQFRRARNLLGGNNNEALYMAAPPGLKENGNGRFTPIRPGRSADEEDVDFDSPTHNLSNVESEDTELERVNVPLVSTASKPKDRVKTLRKRSNEGLEPTRPDSPEILTNGSRSSSVEAMECTTPPRPMDDRIKTKTSEEGNRWSGSASEDDAEWGNDIEYDEEQGHDALFYPPLDAAHGHVPLLSLRTCLLWLFIITLCISALSDILVETIDGFAHRMHLSEVFTSMVVIPFFSNVAEQVSAFLFAYRNEMDLVVGVTIGSAVQIATFVLPASVLIGMVMDRSMTLYFHGYETVCIFFGVVVVGAVLQGGTSNWMVGAILIGIYVIMATGIWFHVVEDLTVDGELAIHNATRF